MFEPQDLWLISFRVRFELCSIHIQAFRVLLR